MYFEDKYFCRFVLSKTPYTKSIHPYPVLALMLFCPETLLVQLAGSELLHQRLCAQLQAAHQLQHTPPFRRAHLHRLAECYNPGALAVPFTATLKSDGAVVNPCVLNIITGQSIRILTTLTPGQVIEIYRTTTDKLAVKRTEDGTEENIFSLLDEDSDLLELAPGDNLLKPPPTAARPACR